MGFCADVEDAEYVVADDAKRTLFDKRFEEGGVGLESSRKCSGRVCGGHDNDGAPRLPRSQKRVMRLPRLNLEWPA